MRAALLLLLALCAALSAAFTVTPFCMGGSSKPFSLAAADQVDVWYVEAPVFETQYGTLTRQPCIFLAHGSAGSLFGYLHAYHCALAFFDRTTGQNWTVEYDAYSGVPNATFPMLRKNESGAPEIVWFNGGSVCVKPFYNESYWKIKQTPVATINGTVFNAFWSFIVKYNATLPVYQLWNVYPSYNASLTTDALASTQDCFEFVWDSFRWFLYAGVEFYSGLAPQRDFINLYSSSLQAVNMSDPGEAADVMEFYTLLHSMNVTTVTDFLALILKMEPYDKFVYVNDTYYRLSFVFPYFAIRYDTWWPLQPSPGPWYTPPPVALAHVKQ